MLNSIRQKILKYDNVVGLEIYLSADGETFFNGVHIRSNRKGELECIDRFEKVKDMAVLKARIPEHTPVCISIGGKGLVVRTGVITETINPVTAFISAANPRDFLFSSHNTGEGTANFYIARKDFIEEWIRLLTDEGLIIVDVYIGTETFDRLLPFMITGEDILETVGYTLHKNKQGIYNINLQERTTQIVFEEISIGNKYYRSNLLIALGNAFAVLNTYVENEPNYIDDGTLAAGRKDYAYYRLFKMTGMSGLLVALGILLVNYLVFSHYFSNNKEMTASLMSIADHNKEEQARDAKNDSVYRSLIQSGWDVATKHGYYIDRIGALVPETISLTSFQSFPVGNNADMHDFIFETGQVVIRGESYDPEDLDLFTNSIKNIQGVRSVTLTDYLYKKEIKGAVFTIRVTEN